MNIINAFRNELQRVPFLNDWIDAMIARTNGVFGVEHNNADGTHTDITADSVTTTGAVTVGGAATVGAAGTFVGDVTAKFGTGKECGIGFLSSVNGTSLLSGEAVRYGVLIGGVAGGHFIETRTAGSPFFAGNELRIWDLGFDTTAAVVRIGRTTGGMTLMSGGTGTTLDIGASVEPVAHVYTDSVRTASLVNSGALVESAIITPAQIVANTNDYNPTGLSTARVLILTTSASFQITGIVAQTTGTRLTLLNGGTQDIVFVPGSGASAAGNRLQTPGNVGLTLNLGDGVDIIYDGTLWRFVGY